MVKVMLGSSSTCLLQWNLDDIYSAYISPVGRMYCDLFDNAGLQQLVKEGTFFPSNNILLLQNQLFNIQ